jgi:AraC-like DNA-binding protein
MNHLLVFGVCTGVLVLVVAGIILYLRQRRNDTPKEELPAADFPDLIETAAIDQFLYDRCCRYMIEKRPFLVESFSLQDLANVMFTNKSYLSRTLNRFSGRNFKQYVNYYRVMYSLELFRNNMGLRISELSSLSGFHTETSYLRNFKQVMGEQPSHWCARVRRTRLQSK